MHNITCVINTLNEAHNIKDAISSVKDWVDEVIVVDMHSSDATAQIARDLGAKVFFHERLDYVEPARAYACSLADSEWILLLDADEMIPRSLADKLIEISKLDTHDIVKMSRANYIFGRRLRYTGWGLHQDRLLRFFKKQSMAFSSEIHSGYKPTSTKILELPPKIELAITHFNYLNVEDFIERLNRYTSVELKKTTMIDRSVPWILWKTVKVFLRRYIRQEGYKDKSHGFYLSILMSFYYFVIVTKAYERRCSTDTNQFYQEIKNDIIMGYRNRS